MHVWRKEKVTEPFVTPVGEIIHELIGLATDDSSKIHSVAHITMAPGASSRKHYHPESEESFYILAGRARMHVDKEEAELKPGEVVLIPPGKGHKIVSIGDRDLEFLAVCVPAWIPSNTVWLEEET